MESSRYLETAEDGLAEKKLNSSASKQEQEGKTAVVEKKRPKLPAGQIENENDKVNDSATSIKTQEPLEKRKENDGTKADLLTTVPAIPKWKTDGKKEILEKEVEVKQKEEKSILGKDDMKDIANKNKTQTTNEMKTKSDNKNRAVDSSEPGRDKENAMNLNEKAKPTQTFNENVLPDGEVPPNTLPGKKVLKRPRQIAPPPMSEKDKDNELLKVRNILKRPVKPGAVTPTDKEEVENVTKVMTKPAWKKPISKIIPPSQGDQSGQTKTVLKRPGKEKEEEKVERKAEARPFDADLKEPVNKVSIDPLPETENSEGTESAKSKKHHVLKKQKPAYPKSASTSSNEDAKDVTVKKKNERTKKIINPISGVKKTPSPKGDSHTSGASETTTLPKALLPRNSNSFSEKTKKQLDGGKVRAEKKQEDNNMNSTSEGQMVVESKQEERENKKVTVVKENAEIQGNTKESPEVEECSTKANHGKDNLEEEKVVAKKFLKEVVGAKEGAVPASQTADSGYGSSPITPLPTSTPAVQEKNKEEEKCEGK